MRAAVLSAALLIGAVALVNAPAIQAQDGDDPGTSAGAPAARDGDPAAEPCRIPHTGYYSSNNSSSQVSPFFAAGGAGYTYAGYGGTYSPVALGTTPNAPVTSSSSNDAAGSSSAACVNPSGSSATPGGSRLELTQSVLASLPLPSTTSIQRGTDLREPVVWLIQTRNGPIMARVQPDGRYTFLAAPQASIGSTRGWRSWSGIDRPAVDGVWQSFAIWWTERGRAWPPD
jgi:hypothetical protein